MSAGREDEQVMSDIICKCRDDTFVQDTCRTKESPLVCQDVQVAAHWTVWYDVPIKGSVEYIIDRLDGIPVLYQVLYRLRLQYL